MRDTRIEKLDEEVNINRKATISLWCLFLLSAVLGKILGPYY